MNTPSQLTNGTDGPRTKTAPQGAEDATATDESSADTEHVLPLDVMFELLSNERRRRVMRQLLESGETTLGDLAERIAAIENDKPEEALSSTERKRVYICLYQCHLPKLDDAGVVDFDEHRKTVEPGRAIEQVSDLLPARDGPIEPDHRDPTPVVALVGSAVGLLLLWHAQALGTWPVELFVAGFITSIVAVSLGWTTRGSRRYRPWERLRERIP